MKVETFPHPIEVKVEAVVYHSEDEEKVKQAIRNLFQNIEITASQEQLATLVGRAKGVESLYRVYEQIRARQTLGVVRRLLFTHSSTNSTWLYFNKQAAYVNVASVCEEWGESPLGPIKMTVLCEQLDDFINWLAPSP